MNTEIVGFFLTISDIILFINYITHSFSPDFEQWGKKETVRVKPPKGNKNTEL